MILYCVNLSFLDSNFSIKTQGAGAYEPGKWCILTLWHGICRVMYERDMKVMNAATFTVQREDHTIGNVIRMYDLHIAQSPPQILVEVVKDMTLLQIARCSRG